MIINDNLSLIANPCCSDTIHAGDIRNHPRVVRVRGVSSGECKHGRCVIGSLGEEYNISHLFVHGGLHMLVLSFDSVLHLKRTHEELLIFLFNFFFFC